MKVYNSLKMHWRDQQLITQSLISFVIILSLGIVIVGLSTLHSSRQFVGTSQTTHGQ